MFTMKNVAQKPIEEGDAAIIIRRDGRIEMLTTGAKNLATDGVTPEQRRQAELLMMGMVALHHPEISQILRDAVAQINASGQPFIDTGTVQ